MHPELELVTGAVQRLIGESALHSAQRDASEAKTMEADRARAQVEFEKQATDETLEFERLARGEEKEAAQRKERDLERSLGEAQVQLEALRKERDELLKRLEAQTPKDEEVDPNAEEGVRIG